MTKISDAEILNTEMQIVAGNVTITAACEGLGITRTTYYRRLKTLKAKQEKAVVTIENVAITIERLDKAAQDILNKLEGMLKTGTGYDSEKHDALDVIKTTVGLITNYRAALQKATFMIDNRTTTINVGVVSAEQWDKMWKQYIDPAMRKAGIEPDRIVQVAEVIDAEWKES